MLASGHVIVLNQNQVLTGESLIYHLEKKLFTLSNALMLTNDPKSANRVSQALLGFSKSELAYEASRGQQLANISRQKTELQEIYRNAISRNATPDPEILERYIILLEKEEQIKETLSPELAERSEENRENLLRRRSYWEKSQSSALSQSSKLESVGYFSLEGDSIRKVSEDQFEAKTVFLSPCMCQVDETPPWGFRAHSVEAQSGGYADLEHPVLEIKGLPVLYLPWIRIPIKNKRQSGFLPPGISHSSVNGNMYSQPVYFAFNEETDATLVADLIEKRGLRLGLEYRVQTKEQSGWEFHFEGIRDKLWLEQAAKRKRISDRYEAGLDAAADPDGTHRPNDVSDPNWWRQSDVDMAHCLESGNVEGCKERELRNRLLLPDNTWRGQFDWKGMTVIAPRLTMVSNGIIASDHRYSQDLWVPSLSESLNAGAPIRLYAPTRFQLHLDGQDFYAGLGSHFADAFQAQERFSGYQTPMDFKLQSRLIPLGDSVLRLPIYFQASAEQKRIEIFKDAKFSKTLPENTILQRLGNGNWRRVTGKFNSPLTTDQAFNADLFADFEYRGVETSKTHRTGHRVSDEANQNIREIPSSRSTLNTLRTGLHFSLPLDGSWNLPGFLNSGSSEDDYETISKKKKLRHRMNWDVTFALRPWVARRGTYGETSEYMKYENGKWDSAGNSYGLTYFPSDRELQPSQAVYFSTSHDWSTFDEAWKVLPGVARPERSNLGNESPRTRREKARQELWYSLDQAAPGSDHILSPGGQWYSNRYRLLEENHFQLLHLESEINYDYKKQKAREEKITELSETNKIERLPEPWSPLKTIARMSLNDWDFDTNNTWNLYTKNFTAMSLGFSPPAVYSTRPGFGYTIENNEILTKEGNIEIDPIKTISAGINTTVIPNISMSYSYSIRTFTGDRDKQKRAQFSSSYASPTNCWGMSFSWDKPFDEPDWNKGTYYMSLLVRFLGHERKFGNITSRYNQHSED